MRQLQNIFLKTMQDVPRLAIQRLLQRKVVEIGRELPNEIAVEWSKRIVTGDTEDLSWDDGLPGDQIKICITDEDLHDLAEKLRGFLKDGLSDLVDGVAVSAAKKVARGVINGLTDPHHNRTSSELLFRINLDDRWGPSFLHLKAMIVFSQEIGALRFKAHRRRKRGMHKRIALSRLHARACQISGEILVLLEAGYADGAMARWRSLHEVAVISTLLADAKEELAQRFVDHEAIDAKNSLDEFLQSQVPLGAKVPSKQTQLSSARAVNTLLAKYGQDYKKPYGWAAHHLGQSRVTFRDLERAAQRSAARWAYKLASLNVHTSPRTFVFSLSASNDMILAGASNLGLEEPGSRTAADLAVITFCLFEPNYNLDEVVAMHVLVRLRDSAGKHFLKTARALDREMKGKAR